MLSETQISEVWEGQIAAETRSLYFADLASLYSMRKQWITGISFFFSSGAAATLIAKMPSWVPISLSMVVAVTTAYAVAVNLDAKIRTMAKLHYGWGQIGNEYRGLWNRVYGEEAESEFQDLQRRELELSDLATTDAPNDRQRLSRWQDTVLRLHNLESA